MSTLVKVAIAAAVLIAFFLSLPTLVDRIVLRNVPISGTQTAQATQALAANIPTIPQATFEPTEATVLPTTQMIATTQPTIMASATAAPGSPTTQATNSATQIAGSTRATEAPGARVSPTLRATETISGTVGASDETESDTYAVQKRLINAEAALRTGELEAMVDYGKGNSTVSLVRFDFGGAQQPARLAITSVYTNSAQTHMTERITIGDQTWQRQDKGAWTTQQEQTTIAEQVGPFLPMAASIVEPRIALQDQRAALAWSDTSRDAELLLLIDRASGIPRELHQTTRQTGQALVITYKNWNMPVTIEAPDVKQ